MALTSQLFERHDILSLRIDKYTFPFIIVMSLVLSSCFSVASDNNQKARHHRVLISGFAFEPEELTVKKGDSITWINKDIAPHNVTISDNQKMISPNLLTGEKFTFKITSDFDYECGLHPSMLGKIIISK